MRGRVQLGRGGEFDVIRDILAEASEPGPDVLVGPGDDALVLEGGWVVSCDLSMEDVHFRRSWLGLREMGYRAGAAALSDVAAMAAEVTGVVVSIAASAEDGADGVKEVAAGVRESVESVRGVLLGGDLSASTGPLVVDVVALGRAGAPVLRTGAVSGDEVWVTGSLGGAAGAVRAWTAGREPSPPLREAFARPTPRIAEARWLAEAVSIHALIDVSDGVAGDAGHLSAASGVRIVLDAEAIPVHPALPVDPARSVHPATSPDPATSKESTPSADPAPASSLDLALRGGEDYELLFTAQPGAVEAVREEFEERFGVALTVIGRVEEGEGVHLASPGDPGGDTVPLEGGGFSHFPEGSGESTS